MTRLRPWGMQPAAADPEINYAGYEMRALATAMVGQGKEGVLAPAQVIVTQHGPDWYVNVAAFQALIQGDDMADQMSYLITATSTEAVQICTAAPPAGTRTHRLVARVRDKRCDNTLPAGTYDWILDPLQDGGGGEPNEPNSCLTLAHITVASTDTGITDTMITPAYPVLETAARFGPWSSDQSAAAAWNVVGTWTVFPGGSWAPISFVCPPSGKIYVTVGGTIRAAGGAGSASFGWQLTGGSTVPYAFGRAFGGNATLMRGSRRKLVTGLKAGAAYTATPWWYQGAAGASDDANGELTIEAA